MSHQRDLTATLQEELRAVKSLEELDRDCKKSSNFRLSQQGANSLRLSQPALGSPQRRSLVLLLHAADGPLFMPLKIIIMPIG